MPTIIAARDNAPRSLNTNSNLTVGRRALKRFIDLENGVWGDDDDDDGSGNDDEAQRR